MTRLFSRRGFERGTVVGIILILCADIVVVVTRGGGWSPTAYLDQVRSAATTTYAVVAPVQRILDALSLTVSTNPLDLYAARDAFAGPTASSTLDGVHERLDRLDVPDTMSSAARQLPARLQSLRDAVASLRADARVVEIRKLRHDLLLVGAGRLLRAEQGWNAGLRTVFGPARPPRLVTPGDFSDDAPTAASWVFGTDEACLQAFGAIFLASNGFRRHQADALTGIADALEGLQADLARVRTPAALPIQANVTERLHWLSAEAGALRAIAAAGARPSPRLAYRLHAAARGLRQLNAGFRRFQVVACVNVIAVLGGGRPAGPGDPRTLQT